MIEVLASGLYTTIQDLGRYGFRKYGVPIAGVMDSQSAALANHLVGNEIEKALLEITLKGPILKFNINCRIAITGAIFAPMVNQMAIPMNQVVELKVGDELQFGQLKLGMRAYLAIEGGFKSDRVMESCSYFKHLTEFHLINRGTTLYIHQKTVLKSKQHAKLKHVTKNFLRPELEVLAGPDFKLLSLENRAKICTQQFKISTEINRMGYRLNRIEGLSAPEIITSPVQPGTVQLTPAGQLIILMRDAQTTGGYARVLQLPESSINSLAQKKSGETVHFKVKM